MKTKQITVYMIVIIMLLSFTCISCGNNNSNSTPVVNTPQIVSSSPSPTISPIPTPKQTKAPTPSPTPKKLSDYDREKIAKKYVENKSSDLAFASYSGACYVSNLNISYTHVNSSGSVTVKGNFAGFDVYGMFVGTFRFDWEILVSDDGNASAKTTPKVSK